MVGPQAHTLIKEKEAYCFVNVIYVMMYIIYYRKISQVLCYKGFRNIIHIKDIEILQTIFLPYTLLRYTYYLNGILIQQRTPMGCFCRRNDTSFIHSILCLMFRKAFYPERRIQHLHNLVDTQKRCIGCRILEVHRSII